MQSIATVIKADNKSAVVSVKRSAACGESCQSCAMPCRMRNTEAEVKNGIGAKEGDTVLIETPDSEVFRSAFLVYILPLLLFFAGYLISHYILNNGIISAVSGTALFAVSFIALHFYDKKHKNNTKIIKIITGDN